jgi:uncharacterized protein YdaU (DUF1376 family)
VRGAPAINYYKHHIGDYLKKTAHLSLAEHGAYGLMLQNFYATEKPLPTGKSLYRLLRAEDRAERAAIDSVVRQFWHEEGGGLTNPRALEELQADRAYIERQRHAAAKRWGASGNGSGYPTQAHAATMPAHANGIDPASFRDIPSTPTPTPNPISPPQPPPSRGGHVRQGALGADANRKQKPEQNAKQEAVLAWKRLVNSDGILGREEPRVQRAVLAAGGWARIRARSQGAEDALCRNAFVAAFVAKTGAPEASP